MKNLVRVIYYTTSFAMLTAVFTYLQLMRTFTKHAMANSAPEPAGDQIYEWNNHGITYVDHTTALIAHNQFLVWLLVVSLYGLVMYIFGRILGLRFSKKMDGS